MELIFILLFRRIQYQILLPPRIFRFQTLTGDAEFRWAVSPDMCLFLWNRISSIFFSKREFMGVKFGKSATSWAYQYNLLQHGQVLRMLLRFGWCSKGPMLGMLYASSFQRFSSKIFIRMPALMDRILSTQWHHLATEDVSSLKNWLPIGSHLYVLATQSLQTISFPEWPMYKSASRIVLQQGPGSTTSVSGSFVEERPETAKPRCDLVASQVGWQQNWFFFSFLHLSRAERQY